MALSDLLAVLVKALEDLGVRYFVTGSVASSFYGEARFTNDIDVVVELRSEHVETFCAAFPTSDFYVSRDAVREAIRDHRMFNVLQTTSGLKMDVIIPANTEFERSRRQRRRLVQPEGASEFYCSSPEDVIVKKLEFYREGGSEKHLRDIASMLKVQRERIDRQYISLWAERFGVADIWELAVQRADQP